MAKDDNHNDLLINDVLTFCSSSLELCATLEKYRPIYIWSQLHTRLPELSIALIEDFRAPFGTAGVECDEKVGSNVLWERRCRISDGAHELQVAIAHNACQLGR